MENSKPGSMGLPLPAIKSAVLIGDYNAKLKQSAVVKRVGELALALIQVNE